MDRSHSHAKLSGPSKVNLKKSQKIKIDRKNQYPMVWIDKDSDFASIKLAPGVEAKSYLKDGVLFSEDAKGRIIELQILNISLKDRPRAKKSKKVG